MNEWLCRLKYFIAIIGSSDVFLFYSAEESSAAATAFELNKCLYNADPEVSVKFKLGTSNRILKSTIVP